MLFLVVFPYPYEVLYTSVNNVDDGVLLNTMHVRLKMYFNNDGLLAVGGLTWYLIPVLTAR